MQRFSVWFKCRNPAVCGGSRFCIQHEARCCNQEESNGRRNDLSAAGLFQTYKRKTQKRRQSVTAVTAYHVACAIFVQGPEAMVISTSEDCIFSMRIHKTKRSKLINILFQCVFVFYTCTHILAQACVTARRAIHLNGDVKDTPEIILRTNGFISQLVGCFSILKISTFGERILNNLRQLDVTMKFI